jgi:hypothetical protein
MSVFSRIPFCFVLKSYIYIIAMYDERRLSCS